MSVATISRSYELAMSHWLPRVPVGHKCGRLHGHTFVVTVALRGEVNPALGWFADFAEIDAAWIARVHSLIDHSPLNEVIENPTTENLCAWVIEQLRPAFGELLYSVAISENSRSLIVCEA